MTWKILELLTHNLNCPSRMASLTCNSVVTKAVAKQIQGEKYS